MTPTFANRTICSREITAWFLDSVGSVTGVCRRPG
jgi:hypothetical protein